MTDADVMALTYRLTILRNRMYRYLEDFQADFPLLL